MIKNEKEIEILRESGRRLARVLSRVADAVRPGIHTSELNDLADSLIREGGDEPSFYNYSPSGAPYPFPAALCVSVNDEIVHGIPGARVLKEGDIVGIDLGVTHKGMVTDMAMTVPVGKVSKELMELIQVTKEALGIGIAAARGGAHVGDIGHAIESFIAPHKYGIVRELCGHGVGHKVHEDPDIPNYGKAGAGPLLRPGMVVALEPMINLGRDDIVVEDDGYTISTRDRKPSAHFEHTILITEGDAEVLTHE